MNTSIFSRLNFMDKYFAIVTIILISALLLIALIKIINGEIINAIIIIAIEYILVFTSINYFKSNAEGNKK